MTSLTRTQYRQGQKAARAALGIKEAALTHLLAGPLGHVAVNALGRAAHRG